MAEKETKNYTNIVLVVLLLVAAFLLGKMWDKSKIIGGTAGTATPTIVKKDPDAVLAKYATQIGLNADQFKSCVSSGKYTQAVKDDAGLGNGVGVEGTPAFFVDGYLIPGLYPLETFKKAIEARLANKPVKLSDRTGKETEVKPLTKDQFNTLINGALAVKGNQEAKVTIVEFSDYQCPVCGTYFREVYPALWKDYGDKVKYVFRDYPIYNIHPLAQKMAEAARCAGEQGKYWELHDLIYAGQADWSG